MDRGKQRSANESVKVARHRNLMHEIALKKQIDVIQREGRILERELREITKVKKTLMQIRDPLRRRVAQDRREDIDKQELVNMRNKAMVLYGLPRQTISSGHRRQHSDGKQEVLLKGRETCQTNSSKRENSKEIEILPNNNHKGFNSQKTLESSTSLPAINSQLTSSTSRSAMIKERRISDDNHSEAKRPETSMTSISLRRRSLTFPEPSPATSLGHRREDQCDKDASSLTMEETLRIKGKFRQIGHSIIATALLKGLRQRGQLTSEAIHNMHKPISFDDKTPSSDNEQNSAEQDAPKPSGLQNFRKLTRKTITVNTVLGLRKQTTNKPSCNDDDKPSLRHRKLGIADVAQTDQSASCSLMSTSTQERRKKIGIGGVYHAFMATKALNSALDEPPKQEKTVRFTQEAWE